MPEPTPDLRARLDAKLRPVMLLGLQDAELDGEPGRQRIGEWADWVLDTVLQVLADQPAEHCIHDRGMHHRHHATPVDGCPWCVGAGTRVDDVPTGGLT